MPVKSRTKRAKVNSKTAGELPSSRIRDLNAARSGHAGSVQEESPANGFRKLTVPKATSAHFEQVPRCASMGPGYMLLRA